MTRARFWRGLSWVFIIAGGGAFLGAFGPSESHLAAFALGGLAAMLALACDFVADDIERLNRKWGQDVDTDADD